MGLTVGKGILISNIETLERMQDIPIFFIGILMKNYLKKDEPNPYFFLFLLYAISISIYMKI